MQASLAGSPPPDGCVTTEPKQHGSRRPLHPRVLHILITATPRPELHAISVQPFVRMLVQTQPVIFDLVRLVVNLDVPHISLSGAVAATRRSFLEMAEKTYSSLTICEGHASGFHQAMRRVFVEGARHVAARDVNTFMWLEDDWEIYEERYRRELAGPLAQFARAPPEELAYLCLVSKCPGGPPHFFKLPFFNAMVTRLSATTKDRLYDDPEQTMWRVRNSLNRSGTVGRAWQVSRATCTPSGCNDPDGLFHDVGRSWRMRVGFDKVPKSLNSPRTWAPSRKAAVEDADRDGGLPGHCGETQRLRDAGCDGSQRSGSWQLPGVKAAAGWGPARHYCMGLCEKCGPCRFLSVSLDFMDCSWYAACSHADQKHFHSDAFRTYARAGAEFGDSMRKP